MFTKLGWGEAALLGVGVAAFAASVVSVPLLLARVAETFPGEAIPIVPLSYLGAALISCVFIVAAVAVWGVATADPEMRTTRRLQGARVVMGAALVFSALSVAVIQVVTGAGNTPGTLILFDAAVLAGLLAAAGAWAYRASHLRRWMP